MSEDLAVIWGDLAPARLSCVKDLADFYGPMSRDRLKKAAKISLRMRDSMAEQWLSIVEYARTFAVSDMTVRRRIKTGKLQAVLKEGKYYIPVGPGTAAEAAEFAAAEARQAQESLPPPPAPVLREEPPAPSIAAPRPGASFRTLPGHLSNSLQRYDNTLVDSQALLQFCEHSMTRINSIERHLQESFQLRLQNMEAQIKLKDSQITQLKQQVEDLQMLVKLMERNAGR